MPAAGTLCTFIELIIIENKQIENNFEFILNYRALPRKRLYSLYMKDSQNLLW